MVNNKNTCSIKLEVNVDANKQIATLMIATIIDGKEVYKYTDDKFRGSSEDIVAVVDVASKLIEKDGRFGS